MVHTAHGLRALLVALLVFSAVAGCGGLGKQESDAAQVDGKTNDVAPLGPDSPPLFLDAAAIRVDAARPQPDASNGQELGAPDAGNTEAGDSTDASPPSADAGLAPETSAPPPVTVIVLPDTQYYAAAYPDVFALQTSWIVQQKSLLNIAAVLHVGDIVDSDTKAQWGVASSALRVLDGLVPYVLVPGNHDTDGNRKTMMNDYFGPATMPWITGTMTTGQIENNYALIDIGPQKWLVLGLEFGPRDAVLTWANTVLKAYPDRPAIIVTHAYLYNDGNRYDVAISGLDASKPNYQWWIPQYYDFTASQGIGDGEQIWQKLILPNPNVRLVFSGHVTGGAHSSAARPDGSIVHQMLSDYQWLKGNHFGYGYLRVLQFDYGKKTIQVQTYSPDGKDYLTDAENQFAVSLEL